MEISDLKSDYSKLKAERNSIQAEIDSIIANADNIDVALAQLETIKSRIEDSGLAVAMPSDIRKALYKAKAFLENAQTARENSVPLLKALKDSRILLESTNKETHTQVKDIRTKITMIESEMTLTEKNVAEAIGPPGNKISSIGLEGHKPTILRDCSPETVSVPLDLIRIDADQFRLFRLLVVNKNISFLISVKKNQVVGVRVKGHVTSVGGYVRII